MEKGVNFLKTGSKFSQSEKNFFLTRFFGLLVKMGGEIFGKADIYLPLHHLLLI